jgi:hypothetical protein
MRTLDAPLIWAPSESWDIFSLFGTSSDPTEVRQSHLATATVSLFGGVGWCSGSMISRARLVTAHHCGAAATINIRFLPNDSSAVVADRLLSLGFQPGTLLNLAIAKAMDGNWSCSYTSQEGTTDLAYYYCWERQFEARTGYFVSLHPGEIFGHLDIETTVPDAGTLTNTLGVNCTDYMNCNYNRVLLSPNGERTDVPTDPCYPSLSPPVTYTGCRWTQGDDALPGTSGGPSLDESASRAWAVWNGWYATSYRGLDGRLPVCWLSSGGPCFGNAHTWAPFTSNTASLQFPTRRSDLPSPSYSYFRSLIGGTGGSLTTHQCASDEAMIGFVSSRYTDPWSAPPLTPEPMGNFGVVCAPVRNSAPRFLQLDHATVRTSTSYDTDFSYSIDTTAYPPRFNRYTSTVLSDGVAGGPSYDHQDYFICPSGYAVGTLQVRTKYGKVRQIYSMTCTHMFDSSKPDIYYSTGNSGVHESGSVLTTSSCNTGDFARGVRVRAGWFTDAIGLYCRH